MIVKLLQQLQRLTFPELFATKCATSVPPLAFMSMPQRKTVEVVSGGTIQKGKDVLTLLPPATRGALLMRSLLLSA